MAQAQPVAKVAPWKRAEVDKLAALIKDSPVVAIATIDKLPSKQFQSIRASVRDHATIRVAKNALVLRALDQIKGDKGGIEALEEHLGGQIALICSDMNPFTLFKTIEGSKARAPAKPGDIAPKDIVVEKGDTPFKPGPVVGDLQKAGMPAKIEGGKVVITAKKVVAKQGEEVSADLASALTRLEILPMIVGLDVKAVWEDGTVFERDVLDVDADAILANVMAGHARAVALAIGVAYPTAKVMPQLLAKAVGQARAVAIEAAFPASDVLSDILARAEAQALAVAGQLSDDAALDDDVKAKLGAASAQAAAAPAAAADDGAGGDDGDDEEDEEEEVSEEDAAAGLGALFG